MVAEPQGIALWGNVFALQKIQRSVDIGIVVAVLFRYGAAGIEGQRGKIKGLGKKLGILCAGGGEAGEIAAQQKVVPGGGEGFLLRTFE